MHRKGELKKALLILCADRVYTSTEPILAFKTYIGFSRSYGSMITEITR